MKRVWTTKEDNYIKDNIKTISFNKMGRYLGCAGTTVKRRAEYLGLKTETRPFANWTEEEINILIELSSKCYIREIAKKLNRTEAAVLSKANKMGLDYITLNQEFTEDECNYIKSNWGIISVSDMARKLKVSRNMVQSEADKMSLPKLGNNPYRKWTEKEIEKLRKLSKENTITELAEYFETTKDAITSVASKHSIKLLDEKIHWTDEDNALLREYAKTMTLLEISNKMNRSTGAVRTQVKRQGINIKKSDKKGKRGKKWTNEEYEKLEHLVMIEKKTPKEISEILGRTEDSIIVKINRIGLKIQTNDKRFWIDEEETLLCDLWGTISIEDISKKLNRTVSSIRNKAFQLGLGSQIESNYEVLKIKEISELFNVSTEIISIYWVALGLNIKTKNITKAKSYNYVEIKDLLDFLKINQNIWDSRYLKKNILGNEPEWLVKKRIADKNILVGRIGLDNLTKQQLIIARKYFLENNYIGEHEGIPYQYVSSDNKS